MQVKQKVSKILSRNVHNKCSLLVNFNFVLLGTFINLNGIEVTDNTGCSRLYTHTFTNAVVELLVVVYV